MGHEALKNFAKLQGGACVYEFSQAEAFKVAQAQTRTSTKHKSGSWNDQGKMYKMVLRGEGNQQEEMGGICATLCAFWLGFHGTQGAGNPFTRDRSVWDYLFNDGGLNVGAAMNIVVEHHQSTGDQLAHIAKILAHFKMVRRERRMSGTGINHVFVPFNSTTSFSCAREITENYGYKLIQIKKTVTGAGAGHMLCAYCDGQDVVFMDPNIGEFWLPNKKAFKAWLTYFWLNTYGSNNNYKAMRVHDYVRNA